jgi:hypothetical protein
MSDVTCGKIKIEESDGSTVNEERRKKIRKWIKIGVISIGVVAVTAGVIYIVIKREGKLKAIIDQKDLEILAKDNSCKAWMNLAENLGRENTDLKTENLSLWDVHKEFASELLRKGSTLGGEAMNNLKEPSFVH